MQIIDKPNFFEDSAYAFIQKQLSFGPRVPGTESHRQCADWLAFKLRGYCDTLYTQEVTVRAGNGKVLPCINLIGVFHPEAKKRILLLAHWDTRPWADQALSRQDQPIAGADDGASGVAVLLEIARVVAESPVARDLGIDILLTDVEDYGRTEWGEDSYALGTQYWATHPHISGYQAEFGILLDMVGARNARFLMEGFSARFAPNIQQRVWRAANTAGFSSYFPFEAGPEITDDHFFINTLTQIPTIDIINLRHGLSPFGSHWHTHEDDIEIIDKRTLEAVGETLLQVIYERSSELGT